MSDRRKTEPSTCEDDVGDVAMTTVGQLLRVGQVAVAPRQIHHERLRVVEGGGLVVQAVRADCRLHHVELLQLHQERRGVIGGREDTDNCHPCGRRVEAKKEKGNTENTRFCLSDLL